MDKTTHPAQSSRSIGARLYRLFMTRHGRNALLAAFLGGIVGYVVGLNATHLQMASVNELLRQTRSENQKIKSELSNQNAHYAATENTLAQMKGEMEAISPTKDTYNLKPNHSLTVGDGRLLMGLIGPPTNESVAINVNGMRHSLATGDIINVPIDGQTNCRIRLQSFDMFKAVVEASCAAR